MPPFLADLHPLDRAPDSAADRALDVAQRATYAAAHTPGPWEAVGNLVRTCRKPDGRGGFLVAECPANIGNRIQDARLIAAAPDLVIALQMALPALEVFRKQYPRHHGDGSIDVVEVARAAIARAIGSEA